MRCLLWAAVSSKPQADETKDSIPTQISAGRELIEQNEGWHEVRDPLVIPGHSRNYIFLADAAVDMPPYSSLMTLAREGQIDLLICRGRDRLGRTDALVAQLEEYLASYNVQILSMSMPTRVQEPKDFSNHRDRAGLWMRSIERAKAQDEIMELRARHDRGMTREVKSGRHVGKTPYGYRKNGQVPEVYEPEAAVVRLIYRWYLEGESMSEIVRRLPLYASERHPTWVTPVRYILRNPFYAGFTAWKRHGKHKRKPRSEWILADGHHEALVSVDDWERTQREMGARKGQGPRAPYTVYALSGLVHCGLCGGLMKIARSGDARYYACLRHDARVSMRLEIVEGHVAAWLQYRLERPEMVRYEIKENPNQEIEQLRKALDRHRSALERWRRDYEDGLLSRSEFYTHKLRLEEVSEVTATRLQEKEKATVDPERLKEDWKNLAAVDDILAAWHDPDRVAQMKALLRSLGIHITITGREITLALK